jgi:hypothetical protein
MEDEYWLDGTLDELNVFLDSPALPDTKRPHATTKRETADGAREDGDEQVEKRKKRNTAEKQRIHRLRLEFEALVDILPNASEKMSRKDIVKTAREEIIRLREATQGNVISDVPAGKTDDEAAIMSLHDLRDSVAKSTTFLYSGIPQAVANFAGIVQVANSSFQKLTGFTDSEIGEGNVGMFQMSTEEELASMYLHAGELIRGDMNALNFKKHCRIACGKTGVFNVHLSVIRPPGSDSRNSSHSCELNAPGRNEGFFHCMIFPDGKSSV